MKKLILLSVILAFLVGCGKTDVSEVENQVGNLFNKYQTVDVEVIDQLNDVVDLNADLTDEQKEKYIDIMKRQYGDLTYTIKKTTVEDNSAIVSCEVTVYDYGKIINETSIYAESNKEEFLTEEEIDNVKYNDYLLEQLEDNKERITYTVDITLTKVDNNWIIDNLTDNEREKINGTYYE